MLSQLVENLEKDLKYISDIKNRLNADCDVCWSLLCPPGKGKEGKFVAGKSKTSIASKKSSEDCCSESNDLYSNVNNLISYGRLIRSDREDQKKRELMRTANKCINSVKTKHMEKIQIKNKNPSIKTGKSMSSDFKIPISITPVCSNEGNSSVDGRDLGKDPSSHSVSEVVSYSHSCSLKLSWPVNNIKMSGELNNLFRLFNAYVDLNSGSSQRVIPKNLNIAFSKKFKKKVKSKFENDLKSTHQCDKYMKFVDLSEEASKSKNLQEPPLIVHYKSKEQIELFEKTSHKLFEMKLQSRMLNALLNFLEETDNESLQ